MKKIFFLILITSIFYNFGMRRHRRVRSAKQIENISPSKQLQQFLDSIVAVGRTKAAQRIRGMICNGADVNTPSTRGSTPLMFVCSGKLAVEQGLRTSLAHFLIQNGARIGAFNVRHETALHLATSLANEDVMRILLECNADPNQQDHRGNSALAFAINNQRTAALLLEFDANPDLKNKRNISFRDRAKNKPEMMGLLTLKKIA